MTDVLSGWDDLTPVDKYAVVKQAIMIDGLTYGQAASRLGAPGRNAIAGVVERNRKNPLGPIESKHTFRDGGRFAAGRRALNGPRQAKPRPKPVVARATRTRAKAFVVDPVAEQFADRTPARQDVWEALPNTVPIAIERHREGLCRWPLYDGPFFYCGQPTGGGNYCPVHHDLGRRELPAAKPRKDAR